MPNDIVVYAILKTRDDAHARFDATNRSYEYRILLERSPFENEMVWRHINKKLNVELMNKAAEILLTFANFKCFSRSNTDVKTYNCDVTNAVWVRKGNDLVFHISADRFLRNMVRAVVGTLIDVGVGKITIEDFIKIIESNDSE